MLAAAVKLPADDGDFSMAESFTPAIAALRLRLYAMDDEITGTLTAH